jgi:hypothetical protein
MDKRRKRKAPGKAAWWSLMAVSGAAVGAAWAVAHAGAVLERLRWGPSPKAPVTDLSGTRNGDVHPGETDDREDGE